MLEKALNQMAKLTGTTDRVTNLTEISKSCDLTSTWQFAQLFNLLDEDRSCETFAIEFMSAFNKEVYPKF